MNEERDKFLTEMIGECWHEYNAVPSLYGDWEDEENKCCKCQEYKPDPKYRALEYNDFSTPDGFFKLFEFAKQQEWLKEIPFNFDENRYHDDYMLFPVEFIEPDKFANSVYEFFKEKAKCTKSEINF